jgi:hypothetical protein
MSCYIMPIEITMLDRSALMSTKRGRRCGATRHRTVRNEKFNWVIERFAKIAFGRAFLFPLRDWFII